MLDHVENNEPAGLAEQSAVAEAKAPPRAAAPPGDAAPSPEFLSLIPHGFARRHLVLSAGAQDGSERLFVAESTSASAMFNVGVRLGRPIEAWLTPAEQIAAAIDAAYARARETEGPAPADGVPRVVVE